MHAIERSFMFIKFSKCNDFKNTEINSFIFLLTREYSMGEILYCNVTCDLWSATSDLWPATCHLQKKPAGLKPLRHSLTTHFVKKKNTVLHSQKDGMTSCMQSSSNISRSWQQLGSKFECSFHNVWLYLKCTWKCGK